MRAIGSKLVLLSIPSTELSEDSIPEPDISLARSADGKAVAGSETMLAIEISDTSVGFDLGRKQRLYARHELPEYWVVDVTERRVVKMWSPAGEAYAQSETHPFGARVESATIPGLAVDTAVLL